MSMRAPCDMSCSMHDYGNLQSAAVCAACPDSELSLAMQYFADHSPILQCEMG